MRAEARDGFLQDVVMPSERAWLVRFCAQLSGNPDAAEDLAQETLLEAWRHRWKLNDPSGRLSWLAAIARNVCSRWRQARARHRAEHYVGEDDSEIEAHVAPVHDGLDLDIELERHELANLLDRAMALLPPDTRTVLIERYVQDLTHSEIAERLNLSEGAVRVRVHRGNLALQRILTEHFTEDVAAYGFKAPDAGPWESTRIWCPLCGNRRLTIGLDHMAGTVTFRCSDCCCEPNDSITQTEDRRVVEGLKSYKAIMSRQLTLAEGWHELLKGAPAACAKCAEPAGVNVVEQRGSGLGPCGYGWVARCRACSNISFIAAHGLALTLPDARRFWRRHPRIRALPEREIEVDGVQTLVVPFVSAAGDTRLDVLATRSDFRVIGIHESPSKPHVTIAHYR